MEEVGAFLSPEFETMDDVAAATEIKAGKTS
jgi:hypothetical protein